MFFSRCRKQEKSKFELAEERLEEKLTDFTCPLTRTISTLPFKAVQQEVKVPVPARDGEVKEQKSLVRYFPPGIYDAPYLFRHLLSNNHHPMNNKPFYMGDFGKYMLFHKEAVDKQIEILQSDEFKITWDEYLRYKGLSRDLFDYISTTNFSEIYETDVEEISRDEQVQVYYIVPPDAREQKNHRIVYKMVMTFVIGAMVGIYRNSPPREKIYEIIKITFDYLCEKIPILFYSICQTPAFLFERACQMDKFLGELLNHILEEFVPALLQSVRDEILYVAQNPRATLSNINSFRREAIDLIDYLIDGAFKVAVFIFDKTFIDFLRMIYKALSYIYVGLEKIYGNIDILNSLASAYNYLQEINYSENAVRLLRYSGETVVDISRFTFNTAMSPALNVPVAAVLSTTFLANETYQAARISKHRRPFSQHPTSSKIYLAMAAFCVVMLGIDALTDCFGLSKHLAEPTGLSPTSAGLLPLLTTVAAAFFGRRNSATPGEVAFEKFRENAFQYV